MYIRSFFSLVIAIGLCTIIFVTLINSSSKRTIIQTYREKYRTINNTIFINSTKNVKKKRTLCNNNTMTHHNVIAYSLFGKGTRWNSGKGEKYRECVTILAKQIKTLPLYKDWIIRIYHDNGELANVIESDHKGNEQVQFCNIQEISNYTDMKLLLGIFWRFLPIGDPTVDISCYRDLDSDLTMREIIAVQEWLSSNKTFHFMRDHPWHDIRVLAGMWCFRNHVKREFGKQLLVEMINFAKTLSRHSHDDQTVLNKIIWDKYGHDSIQHDSYMCHQFSGSQPFPTRRENIHDFVGCSDHNCNWTLPQCPVQCRPKEHPDWIYC